MVRLILCFAIISFCNSVFAQGKACSQDRIRCSRQAKELTEKDVCADSATSAAIAQAVSDDMDAGVDIDGYDIQSVTALEQDKAYTVTLNGSRAYLVPTLKSDAKCQAGEPIPPSL